MNQTSFLQSPDWQSFQETVGVLGTRVGETLALRHHIGPFSYGYLPRIDADDVVLDMLKQERYVFARVEGEVKTKKNWVQTKNRQPQTTLMLDLRTSEADLLASMHSKTRYNIRLSERKGVTVRNEKDTDVFWTLNMETTGRDGFKSHEKAYYEAFIAMDMCRQYTAYFEDTPIASILAVTYDGVTTYVHGASSNAHRNTMAPYLLQWHAIQSAKATGDTQYDFWGIAPIHAEGTEKQETCYNGYCWDVNHKWTGITRFKVGFGGDVVTYPEAKDVILRPILYKLYKLLHKIRYGTK